MGSYDHHSRSSTGRSRGSSSRDGERSRSSRKPKSDAFGSSAPFATTSAVSSPPQRTRTRRRASIGTPAAAPSPDIQNHFDQNDRGRRTRSPDQDVQSTSSGLAGSRPRANVRRAGRRASLAATTGNLNRATSTGTSGSSGEDPHHRNTTSSRSQKYNSKNDAFANSDPFGYNDFGFDESEPVDYGYDNTPIDYGYSESTPSPRYETSSGLRPPKIGSGSRSGRRASAIGLSSGLRDMSIKTPKPTLSNTASAPAPSTITSGLDLDVGLDPFDFSTTTSTPAPDRTQNIVLPTMVAAPEKPRARRRASLIGAISGTADMIGNVGGAIGGAVGGAVTGGNKANGSKLDGGEKRNSNRVAKGTSSSKHHSHRSKTSNHDSAGVGISAYDADRDRRRYL